MLENTFSFASKGHEQVMKLISDGTSEHVAHAWRDIGLVGEKNRFATTFYLSKAD